MTPNAALWILLCLCVAGFLVPSEAQQAILTATTEPLPTERPVPPPQASRFLTDRSASGFLSQSPDETLPKQMLTPW